MTLFGKEKAASFGQIKKYTGLFGSLFSDLYMMKENGDCVQVPIRYGPAFLRNSSGNGFDGTRTGLVLPAMAFELIGISPDNVRKTAPYIRQQTGVLTHEGGSRTSTVHASLPHDLQFQLHIRCKTISDCSQITEQVIAAFDPAVCVKLIDNNDIDLNRDITIKLEPSYDMSDTYEDQQEAPRFVETTLTFILKGYLYKRTENLPVVLGVSALATLGDAVMTWASVQPEQEQIVSKEIDAKANAALGGLASLT